MVITAVRNDRNKKRKPKQDGCVTSQQSEELTQEEETLIGQVVKAHDDTFNKKPDEDKFKVSANRVLVGAGVAPEMNQGEHKPPGVQVHPFKDKESEPVYTKLSKRKKE